MTGSITLIGWIERIISRLRETSTSDEENGIAKTGNYVGGRDEEIWVGRKRGQPNAATCQL